MRLASRDRDRDVPGKVRDADHAAPHPGDGAVAAVGPLEPLRFEFERRLREDHAVHADRADWVFTAAAGAIESAF
jgi:hypothetical protein